MTQARATKIVGGREEGLGHLSAPQTQTPRPVPPACPLTLPQAALAQDRDVGVSPAPCLLLEARFQG